MRDLCPTKTSGNQSLPPPNGDCDSSFEFIGMEFLGPIKPESPNGNKHVLVMTDAFSKWTEVIALPDQTAEKLVEPRWIKSFSIMGRRKLLLQIEGRISRLAY